MQAPGRLLPCLIWDLWLDEKSGQPEIHRCFGDECSKPLEGPSTVYWAEQSGIHPFNLLKSLIIRVNCSIFRFPEWYASSPARSKCHRHACNIFFPLTECGISPGKKNPFAIIFDLHIRQSFSLMQRGPATQRHSLANEED